MLHRPFMLIALCWFTAAPSMAQWQWTRPDGSVVFSDRPPGPEIAPSQILKRPKGSAPASNGANADTAAVKAGPSDNAATPRKPVGADPALEAKKKQADDALAAQRQAAEEKNARIKADNCSRAKQAKHTMDSGVRIAHANANGEREILDDAARAAESKRIQGIIDSDCQ